jgi:phosphoglycolate phosphatase
MLENGERSFRTILFDFDFTLVDSSRGVTACINFALANLGLPQASYEAVCQTIGLSLPDTFLKLAGVEHGARGDEFVRLFKQRADEVMTDLTVIYDSTKTVTQRLRHRDLALGIVSTKFRYRIEGLLKRENLLGAFDVIIGGEDVVRHKPDPEGLLKAMVCLRSSSTDVLYVGDSITDAETARRADVPFAAVLSGVTKRSEFEGYPSIGIFEDLSHLAEWLETR